MKKFIFIFISILCSIISVSAQQIRKVGDIVVVNGELGVVFAVTTDGQHGKAVSVLETKCNWSNAKNWCTQIGTGWRLPTQDELKVIYENMRTINTSLKSAGYFEVGNSNHWYLNSNGEVRESPISVGYGGTVGSDYRISIAYARAVSSF